MKMCLQKSTVDGELFLNFHTRSVQAFTSQTKELRQLNWKNLQPSLGHPNNSVLLSELDNLEKKRSGDAMAKLQEFNAGLKVYIGASLIISTVVAVPFLLRRIPFLYTLCSSIICRDSGAAVIFTIRKGRSVDWKG